MEDPLYLLWYAPKRKLEFFWNCRLTQVWFRLCRGFWPSDCWSLDTTFAKFIIPRLKYFREDPCGYPSGLDGPEEWDKILRRMIWSFEWAAADTSEKGWWAHRYCQDKQHQKRVDKRYEEGMSLFARYYSGLWD